MSLASLIATGTKVWLDGVEPNEIQKIAPGGSRAPPQIRPSSPRSSGEGTSTAESAN